MITTLTRYLTLVITAGILSACVSVPSELRYAEPKLPLGSSNIKGSTIKDTGLLASRETISLLGIDEQFVKGYEGVPYSKNTRIVEGQHIATVIYAYGQDYIGQSDIVFAAESFTDYVVRFDSLDKVGSNAEVDQSTTPGAEESEQANNAESKPKLKSRSTPLYTINVWVEELDSGKATSEKVALDVYYVPTVYVPIII